MSNQELDALTANDGTPRFTSLLEERGENLETEEIRKRRHQKDCEGDPTRPSLGPVRYHVGD